MECNCGGKLSQENMNIIKSKYDMIDMVEAYKRIRNHFCQKANTSQVIDIVSISASSEYTSAEEIYSPVNIPRVHTSVMDGYAVNCNKICIDKEIFVIENIYADGRMNTQDKKELTPKPMQPNTTDECVYVTTGSPIPEYFNCVIPIEYVEQIEYNKKIKFIKEITLPKLKEGSFVRKVGSDLKEGELVMGKNKQINLSDLSLLASVGVRNIKVKGLPKVGILSTGDELVDIHNIIEGKKLDKVIDTNRFALFKLLKEQFPELKVTDYGIANDNMDAIENAFDRAISDKCDILITSGGVSMGEKDLVKKLLETKGEIIFGRLNMKPGKPTTFGKYKNLSVFGLPGNPVSCIVCYYLLLSYSIRVYESKDCCSEVETFESLCPYKIIPALITHDLQLDIERPEFSRGILKYNKKDNAFHVHTTGSQQSSRLKSFQSFNCLIALPKGDVNKKDKLIGGQDRVDCIVIKMFEVDEEGIVISNSTSTSKCQPSSSNKSPTTSPIYTVATMTISDRAYKGEYNKDLSTETLSEYFLIKSDQYQLKEQSIVPDDKELLLEEYKKFVESGYNLIVTSGGTGLSPKDITAEVTRGFIDKEAESLSTYIILESSKITKFACLSNPVVGIKDKTLIINLPGSPKAIKENLGIIENILPHALNQVCMVKDFH